jgi:hypothetical protein
VLKQCTKCNQTKYTDNFAKNSKRSDRLQGICKQCQKEYREKARNVPKVDVSELCCSKCQSTKPVSEFNKASSTKTGYFAWCRECVKKYTKYKDYKDYHGDRRQERLKWVRELKYGQPCVDCGKIYEPACMDYDHIKGNKIKSIARMIMDNTPKETILKEIEKCELVCCLCHNKRTYKRQTRADESKLSDTVKNNREIIKNAKQNKCYSCGVQRDECNMQFDHIESSIKFKNISQLQNYKTETLLREIQKCNVICALCHRRKSLLEQRIGKYATRKEVRQKRYVGDVEQECKRCARVKPFAEFSKHPKTKSGYNSWCRECLNEYKRNRRNGRNREVA